MERGWLWTILVGALVMLMLYRRGRRLFMRQRYRRRRLMVRIAIVGSVGAVLLIVITLTKGLWPSLGLVAGLGLGALGVSLTRFDTEGNDLYFTPNPWVGLTVLSLVVGRLVYRFFVLRTVIDVAQSGGPLTAGPPGLSPLTGAMVLALIGYVLFYYSLILVRGGRVRAA